MTYYERNLPHWHPAGKAIFLTWRLCGSLPSTVLEQIKRCEDRSGRQFARVERFLDKGGFGPLWLQRTDVADKVESCILRGAAELQQYRLIAYVLMPNHVHLLIEPSLPLRRITNGIKGVSAHQANRILCREGQPFWQAESFDHWVRTTAEGERICRYIEHNPVKANLAKVAEDWPWSSAARK